MESKLDAPYHLIALSFVHFRDICASSLSSSCATEVSMKNYDRIQCLTTLHSMRTPAAIVLLDNN